MTVDELKNQTSRTFARMDEIYGCPVFNEWAVVAVSKGKGHVIHYHGPRSEAFASSFSKDIAMLREQIEGRTYFNGEFDFIADGHGTSFDAFIKVSESAFIVCNNTQVAMSRIRGNSQWLRAQVPFAGLCARIGDSPLDAIPAQTAA